MGEAIQIERQSERKMNVAGIDQMVPLLDGSEAPYINLDNAASTPPFESVIKTLQDFFPFYSSVHRGTGFKSRLSTRAYDQAHEIVNDFVGADSELDTVVFVKNTTEALNKLSYRLPLEPGAVVVTTLMEHHSNDLPWRRDCTIVRIGCDPEGRLDMQQYEQAIEEHGEKVALVAVTGASNITGLMPPVYEMASQAHAVGAQIVVDAAQLAPHRAVDMKPHDDSQHLDYVTISAHKMYAPFGTGALIGHKSGFLDSAPEYRGGGTVDVVTEDEVYWAGLPDREEAGSPNVVGAVGLAAAVRELQQVGMTEIAAHEEQLVRYALNGLNRIPGVTIYGPSDPEIAPNKVGVIAFNLEGISHFKLAAILGYEGGIGVRSGCFCAHPYVIHLLDLDEETQSSWTAQVLNGDRRSMPGMVRMSFGCYNNTDDIDAALSMLESISRNEFDGNYEVDAASGEFVPQNFQEPISKFFNFVR